MKEYQEAKFEVIYMDADDIVVTSDPEDTAGDIDWDLPMQDVKQYEAQRGLCSVCYIDLAFSIVLFISTSILSSAIIQTR